MGYILPIQHDAYTQYANRSVHVQSHYSHIVPAVAIQSASKDRKEEMKKQRFTDLLDQKMKTVKTNKTTKNFIEKGKYMNEYV